VKIGELLSLYGAILALAILLDVGVILVWRRLRQRRAGRRETPQATLARP
jgi:hypothetical protein